MLTVYYSKDTNTRNALGLPSQNVTGVFPLERLPVAGQLTKAFFEILFLEIEREKRPEEIS